MQRPRLKPTTTILDAPDGSVYLLRPGLGDTALRDAGPAWSTLLRALDGSRSLDDALAHTRATGCAVDPSDARQMVCALADAGLVEDAAADERSGLPPAALERYDRQLRYFADVLPPHAERAQAQVRLRRSHVVVLGLGGLGSWSVLGLACAGVGRITGVDGDTVELSNLNRQVLYTLADVGRGKAAAAADALGRFDPGLRFDAVHRRLERRGDVAELVRDADAVLALADEPPGVLQEWIDAECFAHGIPYLAASQFPPLVRIGPTYVPGRTGCLRCQRTAWRREHPLLDAVVAEERASGSGAATFGPASGVIGSLLASEVVTMLGGLGEPATQGRALVMDLRTLDTRWEPVDVEPGCRRCQSANFPIRSRDLEQSGVGTRGGG